VLDLFFDVFDRDQSLELEPLVDHEQLLDSVALEDLLRLVQVDSGPDGHEIFFGHHVGDGSIETLLEAQVPVRQDPHQPPVLGHRQTRDAVLLHDLFGLGDLLLGLHRDRVSDHAAFEFLDFFDFSGLSRHRHIAMNDSQAAFLRHRDRRPRLRHRVHCRADQGDIQLDAIRQAGPDVGVPGQNRGLRWDQEDIVERQAQRQHFPIQHDLPPSSGNKKTQTEAWVLFSAYRIKRKHGLLYQETNFLTRSPHGSRRRWYVR
jgi:hypothetical protein